MTRKLTMRTLLRRFLYRKALFISSLVTLILALALVTIACFNLTWDTFYYVMVWERYDAAGNFLGYGGSGGIQTQTMRQTSATYVNGEYGVFPYVTGSVPYTGRIVGFYMPINVDYTQGNVRIEGDLEAGLIKEYHVLPVPGLPIGIPYWVVVGWTMDNRDDWVYQYVDGTYNGKILFVPSTYTVHPPGSSSDASVPVFSSQEEFEEWAAENGVDVDEAMSAPTLVDVPEGMSDSEFATFLTNLK
jgi:hypothetical protein